MFIINIKLYFKFYIETTVVKYKFKLKKCFINKYINSVNKAETSFQYIFHIENSIKNKKRSKRLINI